MELRAEHEADDVDLDAEFGPDEAARLRAAVARSQEQAARGEIAPLEMLLADLNQVFEEK